MGRAGGVTSHEGGVLSVEAESLRLSEETGCDLGAYGSLTAIYPA